MRGNDSKLSFKGQDIYVGLDISKKSWTVTILTEQYEHKTFNQPPVPEKLVKYIGKHFPEANYLCAYEAGLFGFWICDALNEQGVKCIVVHSPDIPTKDREKQKRNDPVDSRKIARNLRNGELIPIYVPSRQAQEDRSLVRTRTEMVRKQTRCKNQIKSVLSFYGIHIPEELIRSHWSNRFIGWLESLEFEQASGKYSLDARLSELKHLRQLICGLTKEIRLLSRQERYRDSFHYLNSIPGIGPISSMVLLTELVDMNRFRNLDHLASYVGLVPGENSSGGKETHTGISRRRNDHLRIILIESSWTAVRKDPALLMAFTKLCKRMPKNQAIIRIARKLLSRIRYVLKNRECYEPCVVS